jgi:uncharacterized membrane protein
MQKRNILLMILLTIITLGIYVIFWQYFTTKELRQKGGNIPIFILYFIPLVNLYWYWKYCEAADQVTVGKVPTILGFILFVLLWPIPSYVYQYYYNNLEVGPTNPSAPITA